MINQSPIFEKETGRRGLPALARDLVAVLGEGPFCLWLAGSIGAGKTTLVGELLRAAGLDARIPVTSPTFTYMNEYEVAGKWYAHLDLYRIEGEFHPEDAGMIDTRRFHGYFVEWPEKIPHNPHLEPTHLLEIKFTAQGKRRSYRLSGCAATATGQ